MVLMGVFLFACGDAKQKNAPAPEGMISLNLSKYGKPFSIFIPDTSSVKLQVTESPSGALEIHIGKNFNIAIQEQFSDIELRKKDIHEDDVNKFKSFVKDTADAVFWESEVTQPEFHFLINRKVGNAEYSFEELPNPDGNPYRREAVQRMYNSCISISEAQNQPKP